MTSSAGRGELEPAAHDPLLGTYGVGNALTLEGSELSFSVIAIGASAGALGDIEMLVRTAPPSAALLVVQHAPNEAAEPLRALLGQGSRPVLVADGPLAIVPGQVVIVPGSAGVQVRDGMLHVSACDTGFPIDTLFREVAEAFGTRASAVLLSGTGSDGSLGLRTMRERGGLTIVQDPASAAQGAMPARALNAGYADLCLTPPDIASHLAHVAPMAVAQQGLIQGAGERRLRDVLAPFGIDIHQYKLAMVERRLTRRMALLQIGALPDYLHLLEHCRDEAALLARDLLINVTRFFRDPQVFDVLDGMVFPRLLAAEPKGRTMRIWVPGCASGEEAYSIVIAALEHASDAKMQVFATDIDERALATARAGVYPEAIALDLSPERLSRYFVREHGGYKVCKRLRESVVFARHDVTRDAPYAHLDLISCRNLLIYLRPEVQAKVLARFHYGLHPHGHLLLGSAETTEEAPLLFAASDARAKFYVKRDHADAVVFDFPAARDAEVGGNLPAQLGRPRSLDPRSWSVLAANRPREAEPPPGVTRELQRTRRDLTCAMAENAILNQELRAKAARLFSAEDALLTMLQTVSAPLLLLDADLRIEHRSRSALCRFGSDLTQDQVPLSALASTLGIPSLTDLASGVLQRGEPCVTQLAGKREIFSISISRQEGYNGSACVWVELAPIGNREAAREAEVRHL